jgi:K+-transporting ATPase ATPase A chain
MPSPATGSDGRAMSFDYTLAALTTAGLLIYLTYALLRPELHGARVRRRAHAPLANPASCRDRPCTALAGVARDTGTTLADLYGRHAVFNVSRLCAFSMALLRTAAVCCRSIRPSQAAVAPDLAFNTAISFLTNTNWQNYGGESTLSYLVQMVGLTHQNFLSAATGIALALALMRGFSRRSSADARQFLGRSHALHALRAAAALRSCSRCSWSGRA